MRILGASSLSSALKRALDFVWAMSLFGTAIMVVTFAIRIAVPDMEFSPIELTAELKKPVGIPLIQSPSHAVVDTVTAEIAFKSPSRSLVLLDGVYWLVAASLTLGVLFHLRRVLASLTAGETFTRANARRLRIIALLWLGGGFLGEARELWSHFYLKATVQFAWGRPHWPIPDLYDLFFALVLIVIAEAARLGAVLEEERALTV